MRLGCEMIGVRGSVAKVEVLDIEHGLDEIKECCGC